MDLLPNIDPFRQRYNELEQKLSDPDVFKDAQIVTVSNETTQIKEPMNSFHNFLTNEKFG